VSKKELIVRALTAAKAQGITIAPGSAAFWWEGDKIVKCSGTGALILYLDLLKDRPPGSLARKGWSKEIANYLSTNSWWLRRFHCGFELGCVVYTPTQDKANSKMTSFDSKGKKYYYKEDEVSLMGIRLSKQWTRK
jgi:hypothetical protein